MNGRGRGGAAGGGMASQTRAASASPELSAIQREVRELKTKVRTMETKMVKVTELSKKNEGDISTIKKQIVDVKRQVSKVCVVMSGTDVPSRAQKENPTEIFCNLAYKKYKIEINPAEIAVCHRRSNGRDLVAKFTHFGPGSSYDRITRRFGNWNGVDGMNIFITIMLTPYDEKIRFYCSQLKRKKLIQNFRTERSGRISVLRLEEDNYKPVEEFEEIKELLTDELIKEIEDFNKQRNQRKKARRTNKGTSPGPVPGADKGDGGASALGGGPNASAEGAHAPGGGASACGGGAFVGDEFDRILVDVHPIPMDINR